MTDSLAPLEEPNVDPEREAATKAAIFNAAERLFALHGFQNVSVRDITAEARVNLASVNYHFGSKDALLFEIFRRRTAELNRERARMLHVASDRHGGKPPVRDVLAALFEPPLRWSSPEHERRISVQFIIRARSEGTEAMREVLRTDVSHLRRFAGALVRRRHPTFPPKRSTGAACISRWGCSTAAASPSSIACTCSVGRRDAGSDVEALLARMLDFAEAGFLA